MKIGILSLQGAVEPQSGRISALGATPVRVRTREELFGCAGLILPGGESTTMIKLLLEYGLWDSLREYSLSRSVWGICAGAILMAERVENPSQDCLGIFPAVVRRNAYGRQNESFIGRVSLLIPGQEPVDDEAVFIRAPAFVSLGDQVEVLASFKDNPVAASCERHLITSYHPELSGSDFLHRHFLSLCQSTSSSRHVAAD
ncbi:MAG: pyridoxal 5'-phosphate synthase glutaminase subunit PdxT [Deltaproteobacteria bacterium]|nr:pyridoxal 5'-phosphate synthase glutaminase subunit PdxT [Deltaproteobacteria bacterium]